MIRRCGISPASSAESRYSTGSIVDCKRIVRLSSLTGWIDPNRDIRVGEILNSESWCICHYSPHLFARQAHIEVPPIRIRIDWVGTWIRCIMTTTHIVPQLMSK